MTTPSDRDELHPLCLARGIAMNAEYGYSRYEDNFSGHDFEEIDGDNGFNSVLKCQVCGWVSGPDFEGYAQ